MSAPSRTLSSGARDIGAPDRIIYFHCKYPSKKIPHRGSVSSGMIGQNGVFSKNQALLDVVWIYWRNGDILLKHFDDRLGE